MDTDCFGKMHLYRTETDSVRRMLLFVTYAVLDRPVQVTSTASVGGRSVRAGCLCPIIHSWGRFHGVAKNVLDTSMTILVNLRDVFQ